MLDKNMADAQNCSNYYVEMFLFFPLWFVLLFPYSLSNLLLFLHVLFITFVHRCPDGMSWKENFAAWYRDFGKYWKIYKQIRHAWDQIEAYVERHCPVIHHSLQGFCH